MPPSCALVGGFAIGARVALLWQQREREMLASVCLYSRYALFFETCRACGTRILHSVRVGIESCIQDRTMAVARISRPGVRACPPSSAFPSSSPVPFPSLLSLSLPQSRFPKSSYRVFQQDLGRSPSRNRIWCIVAVKWYLVATILMI